MTTPSAAALLGKRLKELRDSRKLTQRQLGDLLGAGKPLSPALISSWESGRAVPAQKWIDAYVQLFSRPAGAEGEGAEDQETRHLLEGQLVPLREDAAERPLGTSSMGIAPHARPNVHSDRFWHFPDGQPIRIVGSKFPEGTDDDVIGAIPYANPAHPNHMSLLRFSDADAVVELFGHIRAENPNSDVRFMTPDRVIPDDLNGHVVIVGGGDYNEWAEWFAEQMNVPVGGRTSNQAQSGEPRPERLGEPWTERLGEPWSNAVFRVADPDTGASTQYRPEYDGYLDTTIMKLEGERTSPIEVRWPNLVSDLALVARQRNPLNSAATATLCYGLYARGTYGAARIFTDARVRDTNEQFRRGHFGDAEAFWMLVRVVCNQRLGMTMTPDLSQARTRVLEWPSRISSA
jgi:transcriptional regulator with XRE-family HTH domain